MVGDSTDSVWGVMDVYPITNFPDIRKKAMLISKNDGNLMIIPREGDELVRFYIELPNTTAREVTEQSLIEKVKRIFAPYTIDVAHTVWWSAYVIGQRLADHFTKDYRVFLTGDACHTHSPKAGQGMNVSLQDGFNIGWKMAHVLSGRAPPSVLETYVLERQDTAEKLIEFDRSWSKLFSSNYRKQNGITAQDFRDKFVEAGRYTAGMATQYKPSALTSVADSDESIASGLTVGMRFPSAPVVRLSDAKPMQLNSVLPADGRWHILTFCSGDDTKARLSVVRTKFQQQWNYADYCRSPQKLMYSSRRSPLQARMRTRFFSTLSLSKRIERRLRSTNCRRCYSQNPALILCVVSLLLCSCL